MYEHNALGYWSGLTLCLTKVRSSRARCPATALIQWIISCNKKCYDHTCINTFAGIRNVIDDVRNNNVYFQ